ncbi:Hypothetical Protein FCC1311_043712 [Hondaea fermentalgiana]|uniref:Uncharacterized protein n=1 Tax=Hondaea fermentalgiana TaxID=2315210 RepID=A0A2R5GEH9_9STRA|nr:Hypothetical Protein FCC1311_043712 [Hondaea fermentalgiana]|eukprot:GBG28148.1 Hypothetical Protein FCC1311_043712 [Hondaea fermentalgiana]
MSDSEGDEDVFAAMCEESEQALDLFRDNDDYETQTPDQEDMFAEMCADYQDAAKVFRRMKDLGGELSQARMSEADAKHNVVVKTLDTQEKDCLNALKRKWGARFEAFEKETQVQVDAQRKADAKDRRELREETFESFREKPLLFSATVMDLRQRELSLVKAQDYPQAKVLQEKIERLASEERQRALDTCLRNIEAAAANLEAKQARALRILQDRRNLQLERLKAKARSEEQAQVAPTTSLGT